MTSVPAGSGLAQALRPLSAGPPPSPTPAFPPHPAPPHYVTEARWDLPRRQISVQPFLCLNGFNGSPVPLGWTVNSHDIRACSERQYEGSADPRGL